MLSRTALQAAVLSAGLAAGLVAAVSSAAPASAAVTCELDNSGLVADFYPGESASYVYDETFENGPAIPGLPTYTPQGLTTWANWDGKGNDLLVMGSYRKGHTSRIYGINPATGAKVGDVKVAESHLGGIAVSGSWLFVQHAATSSYEYVRKYKLSDLRTKLKESGTPTLKPIGGNQKMYGADFMSAYGDSIWMGRYSNAGPDKMNQYRVSKEGKLSSVGNPWEIPAATQGVLVTGDRLVFSTGVTKTRLWVYERKRTLSSDTGRCFRSPTHGENLTLIGDTVYHAFEGGSSLYNTTAPNKIVNLHTADLDDLSELVNP